MASETHRLFIHADLVGKNSNLRRNYVRIDGQLYAKRLQKIPPNTVKVISDNEKKYDPFYVDFSKNINFDFDVIGEIRWWGRVAR